MTSAVAKKKNTISMYANVLSMMNCCLSLYVCFVNFIEKNEERHKAFLIFYTIGVEHPVLRTGC